MLALRFHLVLILVLFGLAACSDSSTNPTAPGGEQPAIPPEGDALILGTIDGDVADRLANDMRLTTYDGSQNLEDFDVVIFDGDAHTPDEVRAEPLVAQALRSGKWVLGLDVTEAHKTTGLGDFTLGVSKGDSPAYATRVQQDTLGRHIVDVFEYVDPDATKTEYVDGPPAPTAPTARVARGVTLDTDAFVGTLVSRLTSPNVRPAQASNDIPAGLIYATFNYSFPVPWTIQGTGRTGNSQDLEYTTNYTARVFLNNQNNPQGDYQFVLVDTDVSANPTRGTGTFANMYSKSGHECPACAYDEMAWFQGALTANLSLADGSGWTLEGTSPETVNDAGSVTSAVNFNIGFNTAQGANGSFGYSNAVTRTLTDWEVTNNSSSTDTGWFYSSQKPFDMTANWDCGGQQPGIWAAGCYINAPNGLSLDTMQLHTQAVWRTPSVLSDWITFNGTVIHNIVDLYCNADVLFACLDDDHQGALNSTSPSFQINMAAVVPIPVASLTFSDDNPTAGQQVTGTVTLASPAQVDTTIALQSNSVNATVLPSAIVRQGQTSATFQIDTNADGLSSGNSTVATIDAFYAQNVQAQLTVAAP